MPEKKTLTPVVPDSEQRREGAGGNRMGNSLVRFSLRSAIGLAAVGVVAPRMLPDALLHILAPAAALELDVIDLAMEVADRTKLGFFYPGCLKGYDLRHRFDEVMDRCESLSPVEGDPLALAQEVALRSSRAVRGGGVGGIVSLLPDRLPTENDTCKCIDLGNSYECSVVRDVADPNDQQDVAFDIALGKDGEFADAVTRRDGWIGIVEKERLYQSDEHVMRDRFKAFMRELGCSSGNTCKGVVLSETGVVRASKVGRR